MNNRTINMVFIGFVVVSIVLTISFLWKENLDLSKPINYDKFNAYFASVAAIGTAFSLFLIYNQNKMMYHASVATYKPDIIVERGFFWIAFLVNHYDALRVVDRNDQTNELDQVRSGKFSFL